VAPQLLGESVCLINKIFAVQNERTCASRCDALARGFAAVRRTDGVLELARLQEALSRAASVGHGVARAPASNALGFVVPAAHHVASVVPAVDAPRRTPQLASAAASGFALATRHRVLSQKDTLGDYNPERLNFLSRIFEGGVGRTKKEMMRRVQVKRRSQPLHKRPTVAHDLTRLDGSRAKENEDFVVDESIGGVELFIVVVVLWTVVFSWNHLFVAFVKEFYLHGRDPNFTDSFVIAVGTTAVFFLLIVAAGLDWQYLLVGDVNNIKKKKKAKSKVGARAVFH